MVEMGNTESHDNGPHGHTWKWLSPGVWEWQFPGFSLKAMPGIASQYLIFTGPDSHPVLTLSVRGYLASQQGEIAMDRGLELRIKGHLYEIEKLNDDVIESRQGLPMALKGYEKTLQAVAEDATTEHMDEVAEGIKEHIRRNEDRPKNRQIRRDARKSISEDGHVPGKYLNAV